MTNGLGEVYWSPRARQFYQVGRRGAVSREQGIKTLRYDPEKDAWRDVRGRTVDPVVFTAPARRVHRFLARDAKGRPFVSTEFMDRQTTREGATARRLEGNQLVVVRTVVRLPNGKLLVSYTSSRQGRKIDIDALDQLADKRAVGETWGAKQGMSYSSLKGATITREYYVRTVQVRGRS